MKRRRKTGNLTEIEPIDMFADLKAKAEADEKSKTTGAAVNNDATGENIEADVKAEAETENVFALDDDLYGDIVDLDKVDISIMKKRFQRQPEETTDETENSEIFADAEKAEAEQTEAEQTEAEQTEAEQTEAEQTEAEHTDVEQGEADWDEAEQYVAEQADDDSDETASKGLKAAGIAAIVLTVAFTGFIGVAIYFLVINPSYLKEKQTGNFDVPYVTATGDAIEGDIEHLSTPSDAKLDDVTDVIAEIDANAKEKPDTTKTSGTPTDATVTDATATDAKNDDAAAADENNPESNVDSAASDNNTAASNDSSENLNLQEEE